MRFMSWTRKIQGLFRTFVCYCYSSSLLTQLLPNVLYRYKKTQSAIKKSNSNTDVSDLPFTEAYSSHQFNEKMKKAKTAISLYALLNEVGILYLILFCPALASFNPIFFYLR